MSKLSKLITSRFNQLRPKLVRIVQRQCVTLTLIGALGFGGSAIIGLIGGIAKPTMHDEFSYLLAADTFAHGRITNPTHPMWIHFESVHIIHVPTYMSKYPPAQGAILALGQRLSGYPIVSVWLSIGLMCSAICWMLYAWVPTRWAVLGGFLSVLHPIVGIGGYWAQSYWGGAVAATGAALVLGGIRRLVKEPQVRESLLTGLGLALLANSRPFEGLLLSICATWMLFFGLRTTATIETRLLIHKVVLPLTFTCSITAAWMCYYNYRITGNVFHLPYQIHEQTYGVAPLFVWQTPKPVPLYRHTRIGNFHGVYTMSFYNEKHSVMGFAKVNLIYLLVHFILIGNVLVVPLLLSVRSLARWMLSNPWARRAFATYTIVTIGIMLETYTRFHYWAPILPLDYYFMVQAIRLWWHRNRRIRPFIIPVTFCLIVIVMMITVRKRLGEENDPLSAQSQRVAVLTKLEQQAGKHLILVRYGTEQSEHREWVYNEADIDGARVVWARDMNRTKNCKLVDYFKDRVIWSLDVEDDDVPVKLNPFPRDSCQ